MLWLLRKHHSFFSSVWFFAKPGRPYRLTTWIIIVSAKVEVHEKILNYIREVRTVTGAFLVFVTELSVDVDLFLGWNTNTRQTWLASSYLLFACHKISHRDPILFWVIRECGDLKRWKSSDNLWWSQTTCRQGNIPRTRPRYDSGSCSAKRKGGFIPK